MKSNCFCVPLMAMILTLGSASVAKGEISFVSGTNGVILSETVVDENGDKVFIFDGISEGQGSPTFVTDSACPGVAVTGGGEFASTWTCGDGVISASVVDRGGLVFRTSGVDGHILRDF